MSDMFATYGPDVVAWVLAALGTLLSTYVWTLLRAGYAREALQRAWLEVQGAVLEVAQTYSDEIKRAREDGTLTDDEKRGARDRAIAIAKGNLGAKGIGRLARVIGVNVDQWLASKTEQAVKILKTPEGEAPLPTMPSLVPSSAPPSPRSPA